VVKNTDQGHGKPLTDVKLLEKHGGKSGSFVATT
jgi:hypothetical protein